MNRFPTSLREMREEYPSGHVVQIRVLLPDESTFEFEGAVPEEPATSIMALLRAPNITDEPGEDPTRGIRGVARETRE